jgi:hypothetical protein
VSFKPNQNAKKQILSLARKRLALACEGLVTYIKTVKLSKGRRGLGDHLAPGDPPYGGQANTLRNSVMHRWKSNDPNTQQVGTNYRVGLIQEVGAPGPGVRQPIGRHGLMAIALSDAAIKHRDSGGGPRTFPKILTMIRSTGRPNIFFLIEKKRGGKVTPARSIIHYVLAKSARIPPHPWLYPSLIEYQAEMLKIMGGGP